MSNDEDHVILRGIAERINRRLHKHMRVTPAVEAASRGHELCSCGREVESWQAHHDYMLADLFLHLMRGGD